MAIWLIRAGSHGEHEQKFIQDNRVYVTWDALDVDLAKLTNRSALVEQMAKRYPGEKPRTIRSKPSSTTSTPCCTTPHTG